LLEKHTQADSSFGEEMKNVNLEPKTEGILKIKYPSKKKNGYIQFLYNNKNELKSTKLIIIKQYFVL